LETLSVSMNPQRLLFIVESLVLQGGEEVSSSGTTTLGNSSNR